MSGPIPGEAVARELQDVAAALGRGDFDGAVRLAHAALVARRTHPLFFKLRAVMQERQGRLSDAIQDFRSALALAPDDFAALSALGSCLARPAWLRSAPGRSPAR